MSTLRPEWLHAVLPLGVREPNTWRPLGVGTLFLEADVLWLATPTSLLLQAADAPLVAWPTPRIALTISDSPDQGLAWLPHPTFDLSIRPFPADPAWGLRAFKPTQCAAPAALLAGQACLSAGFAYALSGDQVPPPSLLGGRLVSIQVDELALVTSAPMLPHGLGSPVLLDAPDAQAVCGFLVKRVWVPQDEDEAAPPLGLTVALSSTILVGHMRSPQALDLARRAAAAEAQREGA